MQEVKVTLGEQLPVGQAAVQPNARLVMVQPSAKMPDGSIRALQPYEVVVTHRVAPVDLLGAVLAGVALLVAAAMIRRAE